MYLISIIYGGAAVVNVLILFCSQTVEALASIPAAEIALRLNLQCAEVSSLTIHGLTWFSILPYIISIAKLKSNMCLSGRIPSSEG